MFVRIDTNLCCIGIVLLVFLTDTAPGYLSSLTAYGASELLDGALKTSEGAGGFAAEPRATALRRGRVGLNIWFRLLLLLLGRRQQ